MNLLTPRISNDLDYLNQLKFLLIWRMALGMSIIFSALTIVFVINGTIGGLTYFLADLLIIFGAIYLFMTSKHKFIYMTFVYVGTLIIHLDLNSVLSTSHYGNFSWMSVLILLSFFGLGIKHGMAIIFINVLAILYFVAYGMEEHYVTNNTFSILNKFTIGFEFICTSSISGYLIYLFINSEKYYAKQLKEANLVLEKSNELIKIKNDEKTILVKEIHHRVKNNLQIITSLFKLQMDDITNEETRAHFSEAINRVMVMSSIHQKLYQESNLSNFKLSPYIKEIAEDLKGIYAKDLPIDINVKSNYEKIDLKTAVPVGLILNELLSNSFKYAFMDMKKGEISIEVIDLNEKFALKYSDNGKWVEADERSNTFGMELINILTEQLDGTKKQYVLESGSYYEFELNKYNGD